MRGSNIRQFAEGCARLGVENAKILQVQDVQDGSAGAATRVAAAVMAFFTHKSKAPRRGSAGSSTSSVPTSPGASGVSRVSPASSPSSVAARARAVRSTINRRMSNDMPASPMHSVLREAELHSSPPRTPERTRRVLNRSITEPITGLPMSPALLRAERSPHGSREAAGTARTTVTFVEPDRPVRQSGSRPTSSLSSYSDSVISPVSLVAQRSRRRSGLSESTRFTAENVSEGSALELDDGDEDIHRRRESSGKTLRAARDRFNALHLASEQGHILTPSQISLQESMRLRADAFAESLAALEGHAAATASFDVNDDPASATTADKPVRPSLLERRGSSILFPRDRPAPVLRRRSMDRSSRNASPVTSPDDRSFRHLVYSPPVVSPIREDPPPTPSYVYAQPDESHRLDRAKSSSQAGRSRDSPPRPQSVYSTSGDRYSKLAEPIVLDVWDRDGRNVGYKLGGRVGRGQFGTVYKSLNLSTGEVVAVKRISLEGLDDAGLQDVMREVEIMKRLEDPRIVKYEGLCIQDNHLHIILESVTVLGAR